MMKGYRLQAWLLSIAMVISVSVALSHHSLPVLPTNDSGEGQGLTSMHSDVPENLELQGYDFAHSLKTLSMRLISVKRSREDLYWPKLEFNWRLVIAIVLGSIGASLCSAGGVGGGGLFIPIFNLLLGFDAKSAAALSNFMILGGSIANVGWNFLEDHPHLPGKPLIDFDVALLLQPNMLLGISLGVICNVIFPSWFVILEFILVLGYITVRSFKKGLIRWKKETEVANMEKRIQNHPGDAQERGQLEAQNKIQKSTSFSLLTGCVLEEGDVASEVVLKRINSKNSRQNSLKRNRSPSHLPRYPGQAGGDEAHERLLGNTESNLHFPIAKLLMLGLVWLAYFAVQILRGGKSGASLLKIKPCGNGYWLLTVSQIPLAIGLTVLSALYLHHVPSKQQPLELQEEYDLMGPKAFVLFPGMALFAGFLGGMLGLGGGMIVNPLLLEIGLHPQITAATCAFMVFFSSSMSVLQFWLLGRIPFDFALLFAAVCLVSSLIGLRGVHLAIEKFGRASIIVFSVTFAVGASTILTAIFGGLEVWEQYTHGVYMGFHTPC